ncbi:hypothetical protein ACL00O_19030 [Aeromonas sanarellii]|uniref:hypothetical protein n=1 Tax=Aeromonas sanarellii TaxID=633415 RepID=UPI0039A34C83
MGSNIHAFPFSNPNNKPGGTNGGDGGDGVLERVAKLESDVGYIKRDVAEIKTSLGKVSSDVGEIKITLTEIKARQDTFSTKEQVSELAVSTKEHVAELATSTKERFGEVNIMLTEIKAKQETFATKEALQEVNTAVQSSANKVILAMFTIAALLFSAIRFFPAPAVVQPQTQVSGSAAVSEPAPVSETKK